MAGLIKRGKKYYAVYQVAGKERRRALETTSYQVAKERLRNLEASLAGGTLDSDLPTKTPLAELVEAYVGHIRTTKTRNSIKVDTWYLRSIFGPICPALEDTGRCRREKGRGKAAGTKAPHIEVAYVEQLTTAVIAQFIDLRVQQNGIGPKTANRYREIMMRLITWATDQRGVRMPGGVNPAAKVERRRQPATTIRFLTIEQIQEQMAALSDHRQLQTMVAVYIYAGLRREEALWLTFDDVDLRAGTNGMLRLRAKTINGEFWEPKTKVNRAVPISRALREYLERYEPRVVPGRWYFPSIKGARWDPDNFSCFLRDINKATGLPWSCLDFRHTFGSHLAMKGESLYKISALMGNSPDICRRHYAALLPESLVDSVEFGEQDAAPKPLAVRASNLRVISIDGRLVDSP